MQFHQWAKSVRPVVPGNLHGPSYARELISMFTTVNEGEWNTRNDPTSTASISDDVLTSLMSRDAGFSKGLANAIYSRLNIDNLICLIEDLDEPAQNLIRLNFESFEVKIRLTHVAEDACLILLDILERLAKIKKPDLQARIRIRQLAAKARYREELLVLSDGCLQCGKTLNIESHDKSKASYVIVLLDEDIEEPFAMISQCYAPSMAKNTSWLTRKKKNNSYELTLHVFLLNIALPTMSCLWGLKKKSACCWTRFPTFLTSNAYQIPNSRQSTLSRKFTMLICFSKQLMLYPSTSLLSSIS